MSELSSYTRPDDPWPDRRQLDTLTAADLDANPAWWFPPPDGRLSGPDASTVVPVDASSADASGACEFPEGRYLLRAEFTLADGSVMTGHVTYETGDGDELALREPTLCAPRGQVPLWHGVLVPDAQRTAAMLAMTGRARDAVFPLRWRATIHPPGRDLAGEAAGFAVLRDGRTAFV